MKNSNKVCLLSIIASHYRQRIYLDMQEKMGCDFIFGKEDTTVKEMDTTQLQKVIFFPNKHIGHSQFYRQPGLIKATKGYDVLINDLGLFCVSAWILLIVSKFRGQRVINWDHGWYGRESFVKKIIKRMYFGLASASLIYGNYAVELMKKNGFNAKKLYVVHNSLDYNSQLALRQSIGTSDIFTRHFDNGAPVLIMIGRLNDRKKLEMLIEATALLRQDGYVFNMVFVGDGEERTKLEALVQKDGLESQAWFYGACYDEKQNAELLYNADLCVVPGDIGLTAIHSMMFGVPIISHDYFPNQGPEFEAIKEGVTGLFFKNDDVDSLAAAILRWFGEHREDREAVRQTCFEEIDNYWTPDYQIDIIQKAIEA